MKFLVTGGAGFIGSALVRHLINNTGHTVLNVDKLTYAGNLDSLQSIENNYRYFFEKVDICNKTEMKEIIESFKPDYIMHLAAESHVDRSIDGSADFINTNIIGTYTLLEVARSYWNKLHESRRQKFRFLYISTDEVYGSLGSQGFFTEESRYKPNSPYSSSKASADHLVRAWYQTYQLPTLITNCSNNYGPYQFPEKLIPVVILNALKGKSIPVYGKGENIRDWLFVDDHIAAMLKVLEKGNPGETYLVGGKSEKNNLQLINKICEIMDEIVDNPVVESFSSLITFVKDRPGHDMRYAIDPSKIEKEIGWKPQVSFEEGMKNTVQWYIDNQVWCDSILSGEYRLERIGLGGK